MLLRKHPCRQAVDTQELIGTGAWCKICLKEKSEAFENFGKMPSSKTTKQTAIFPHFLHLDNLGMREGNVCVSLRSAQLSSVNLLDESFVWRWGCREHTSHQHGALIPMSKRDNMRRKRHFLKKRCLCKTTLNRFSFCSFLSLGFR